MPAEPLGSVTRGKAVGTTHALESPYWGQKSPSALGPKSLTHGSRIRQISRVIVADGRSQRSAPRQRLSLPPRLAPHPVGSPADGAVRAGPPWPTRAAQVATRAADGGGWLCF